MLQLNGNRLELDHDTPSLPELVGFLSKRKNIIKEISLSKQFLSTLSLSDTHFMLEKVGLVSALEQVELAGGEVPMSGLSTLLLASREHLKVLKVQDVQLHANKNSNAVEAKKELQAALYKHPSLEEFSLINFDIVEDGVAVSQDLDVLFHALCSIPTLSVIRLGASSSRKLSFNGTAMAPLFASVPLRELHFSHFDLTKMHLRMLAWGVRKAPLEKLALKYAGLDDEDVEKLSFYLGRCQRLRQLDLSGNTFGDAGCIALAEEAAKCPTLVSMNLMGNKNVGKNGYASLSRIVGRSNSITSLEIPSNESTTADPALEAAMAA